ncbi:tRNA 5-methylaminomethyl-2-thiouridine biosynthesis bifunctional protein [Pseudomonas duriflava]|uniref:tRNA 5-methylaminomethyl-2-thiouridine biosynthesis bifunctional protein MnmC n=1 Tax=Pseudomonas duriflava TaxID=459528 RepID=A0A562Q989_9PSED|nr:bifunctional tRNA (5-methylaminomethyl-2-thiouridine)(34)-methyltransferase MnmD/FAD-dependent 5-carboxymethylaminomethyl-2-thiouridine(34) oxidoreductase MnmC [Pseudomonas duriflava]TWI53341.1 tRNA 5-methylaminomethyl-2-thiouridine biosynthesis bifunctional protein [Pseudomonas duriflava]
MSELFHAQLDWDCEGQPHSRVFDDVYFSRANGLEETRYVFLEQNALPARFAALTDEAVFTIGETGFGTGLNFLCAWQLFEQVANARSRLHFVSVEKYPLALPDLIKALSLWPELAVYVQALIKQYIGIHAGFQRFVFAEGRITLTLLIGDALERLPELDAQCNAWFLDGFAPAKNPDMWTPTLFEQLARLSATDATLATFTCAGFVRRGLIEAGFRMEKTVGFGHKREMLKGHFTGMPSVFSKPWFQRLPAHSREKTALVIGAGLAGAATAASLARRGWHVTVIERHPQPAAEASGNLQGILYLKLSAHLTSLSRLALCGFGYTRRLLEAFPKGADWDDCGTLQLAYDMADDMRQQALAELLPSGLLQRVDAEEASRLAGISLERGGLYFPTSGWVHPPALCRHLLNHPFIHLKKSQETLTLERQDDYWTAHGTDGVIAKAAVAIIAGATDTKQLAEHVLLPVKPIRGQLTHLPATPNSSALQCVLCAEGYVAPPRKGWHTVGASFTFDRTDSTPSQEEHDSNLALLEQISPELTARLNLPVSDTSSLEGRVAFRCTTPDYLPAVGPVVAAKRFAQCYAALAKDARQIPDSKAPWIEGLFINTAHGSRGLISAPLSGELIAAWLENEPLPLPRDVAEACHPNRFPLKAVIRGHLKSNS